jgi:hypothetical protein
MNVKETQRAELDLMKHRLLLSVLNETEGPVAHAQLIQAAEEAVELAWAYGFPLLVFPCLFEERTSEATERIRQQEQEYWASLQMTIHLAERPRRAAPGQYLILLQQNYRCQCRGWRSWWLPHSPAASGSCD